MNKLIEEYTQRIQIIRDHIKDSVNLSPYDLDKLNSKIDIFTEFIYKLQSI